MGPGRSTRLEVEAIRVLMHGRKTGSGRLDMHAPKGSQGVQPPALPCPTHMRTMRRVNVHNSGPRPSRQVRAILAATRHSGSETASDPGPCRPAYLALHRSGELLERARRMWSMMGKCRLCPRECGANRLQGKRGFCGTTGTTLTVSSFHPHFGEERPLVGTNGSGTIFFALQPALCLLSELGNQHAGLWR